VCPRSDHTRQGIAAQGSVRTTTGIVRTKEASTMGCGNLAIVGRGAQRHRVWAINECRERQSSKSRDELAHDIGGGTVRLFEEVGVDVESCRSVAVAEPACDGANVNTCAEQLRRDEVA